MKLFEKATALVLVLAMATTLAACNGTTTSTSTSTDTSSTASSNLAGKPWIITNLQGNLPSEQPSAKDDVYAHYAYDYLSSHQENPSSAITDHAGELQTAITSLVKNESATGHDIEQLRILYNQAADTEALQAAGISEIQPYLDRIDAVTSIDEMNELITSSDFPFDPFIQANISTNDTRTTNIVAINPNLVLCDVLTDGGTYYQESDDQQTQQSLDSAMQTLAIYPTIDFMSTGMEQQDAGTAASTIVAFEKAHGKYVDSPSTYVMADYGAMADAARDSYCTLDEMCALSQNFPMRAVIDKMGKGGSETYVVTKKWLTAFDGMWTADNLDAIKTVAKGAILKETRPYRDPSTMNEVLAQYGATAPDADTFAYNACTSIDTLANVAAEAYVENALGAQAKTRLGNLAQNLVNEYKDLANSTSWMSEESKQRVIEKLDNMTLNVLEPTGGYYDYSGLNLTPTDQGGTLFSNYLKCKRYREACDNKLIGQPAIAASPWYAISPTTNNAFYDSMSNSINIMPGFITSLIYSDDMTESELIGTAGWTIGHEISHGFDYMGSQLDAYGTPNPVYTEGDIDKFVLKSSTLALRYSQIEVAPGQMVSGDMVAAEATADLCGVQACLELASKTEGFNYDEYFSTVSNMWASVLSPRAMQQSVLDTHPLSALRVNVSLQMLDATYERLGIVEGDGMYLAPEERIVIWGDKA